MLVGKIALGVAGGILLAALALVLFVQYSAQSSASAQQACEERGGIWHDYGGGLGCYGLATPTR